MKSSGISMQLYICIRKPFSKESKKLLYRAERYITRHLLENKNSNLIYTKVPSLFSGHVKTPLSQYRLLLGSSDPHLCDHSS